MSVHYFAAILTILSLCLPMFAVAHPCSEGFHFEAEKRKMTNCKTKALRAELGWTYHNATRTLNILFGARLDSEMGWMAWGVNPGKEAMMEGTRALIGIKLENQTLAHGTYNITHFTKLGCELGPSKNIDLDVRNFSFFYVQELQLHIIEASIVLSPVYNVSRTNVVWQIGDATAGMEPKKHPQRLANFDSKETIDLISGNVVSTDAHPRKRLRMLHGILNIVGWGTLLPIGVIIARYFRSYPKRYRSWYVLHVSCQSLGWTIGTGGWLLGIVLGDASKHYSFHTHRILAIIIFTFTTLQMLALRLRPRKHDDFRIQWNVYHYFLGYSLLAIISANIFQGIAIFSADNTWKWAYISLLSFLGFIAVILECFTWISFKLSKSGKCWFCKHSLGNDEQPKGKSQTSSPGSPYVSESNEPRKAGIGLEPKHDGVQPSSSSHERI